MHHDEHDHHGHDNSHFSSESHHHAAPIGGNLLGPAADEIADCPVMPGSTIVKTEAEAKGLFRDYEGNRYWLCCAACGPLFDADPAKFAAAA
jgi:YHS domain-containing protein